DRGDAVLHLVEKIGHGVLGWSSSVVIDREDVPLAGDAFERVGAVFGKPQARAGDEVLHGARHQDLASLGERGDPGPDVHGDAAELLAHNLALAGVYSGPHFEPETPDSARDGRGRANTAGWAIERGQKAVAGGVDLATAELLDLLAHEG